MCQRSASSSCTRWASDDSTPALSSSRRCSGGSSLLAIGRELALGFVAGAGHFERAAGDIELLHRHFILGQRAGLVGANHAGAAERFHGRQTADQGVPLDHPLHADRQRDGHDRRQGFRHDGDGQSDAKEQQLGDRLLILLAPPQAQRHDDDDDHQRHDGQRPSDAIEVLLQRRAGLLDALQHPGDLAELGVHAGGDDDGPPAAIGDGRARKGDVRAVAGGQVVVRQRLGLLFDRDRFARERRFIGLQVVEPRSGGSRRAPCLPP